MKLSLSLQLNSPRFGVSYNPLDIPSIGEWFDYRTLAGTSDGAPVGSWAGKKGLYTATAAGAARPTYAADAGDGRGALSFDGVDDNPSFAMTTEDLWGPDGNYEAWYVVKAPAPVGSVINSLAVTSGTPTINMQIQPAYTRFNWYSSGNANYGDAFDIQDDAWHVLRFTMKPSGPTTYVDGVEVGFGSDVHGFPGSWATGAGTTNIGSASYGTDVFLGYYRHFLTFKAPLSDDDAAALTSYLTTA